MKLVRAFDALVQSFRPHFRSTSTFARARALAYAMVVTLGRHTITRLICTKNELHKDWSADYKFFSKRLWNPDDLFLEIFKACDAHACWANQDIVAALDDTNRQKTGKKIPGVTTLRDPMSLPFHVNLRPALRYMQASVIVNPENHIQFHRAIPVYFQEAAPAKKPRANAPDHIKEQYEREKQTRRLSIRGHQAALHLRTMADSLPNGASRRLFIVADGSYCNQAFLNGLPATISPLVRTRKDLKIFAPADPSPHGRGRQRLYGERLPTPEQIRKDDSFPWHTARVFAAGKYHDTRYKTMAPVLWKKGTKKTPCRLIIIAPLRYAKGDASHPLYREPGYIITTDVTTPVDNLIQFYFLRWDIEVNHRDEKSLLGVGDAQMRSPNSVVRNPQFAVIVYSLLLLASINAYGPQRSDDYLPLPKWRKQTQRRPSTLDEIAQMRREIMEEQLQLDLPQPSTTKKIRKRKKLKAQSNKSNFVPNNTKSQNDLKSPVNIIAALIYADS